MCTRRLSTLAGIIVIASWHGERSVGDGLELIDRHGVAPDVIVISGSDYEQYAR